MLFGEADPTVIGKGSSSGEVRKGGQGETVSLQDAIAQHYNN